MPSYDFVVLGGGMAGVSMAAELGARATVLLIEREPAFAYHSTGRSAALFEETYGPPLIRALTRASRAFFANPGEAFAPVALCAARGALLVAGAGREAGLQALAADLGPDAGYLVGREDCVRMAPILRAEQICGAYFEPGAMDLDVDAILQGFMRLGRERGVRFVKGVDHLAIGRVGQGWKLRLEDEVIDTSTIINAAGAWADEVAVDLGAKPVGLSPLRRTAILIDPPAGPDVGAWPAVMDADGQYYFKPDAGKLLLSPADETPSPAGDVQPDELDIAIAIDRVQQVADLPVRRVNHAWAGLRTFSPDGLPVVGPDPQVAGLFWLAGQGGYGIQTAPALARLAAGLALGDGAPRLLEETGVDLEAISPLRYRAG